MAEARQKLAAVAPAASKDAVDYLERFRKQLHSAVKQGEQFVLDTVGSVADVAAQYTPTPPSKFVFRDLPTVEDITRYVNVGFNVVADLVASQREFTTAMISKLAEAYPRAA